MPKWILFVVFTISLYSLPAQQVFVSLDQFTDYALQHNPAIQQSILNEKVESQNVNTAIAPMLPTANAQATINDNVLLPTTLVPAELRGGPPGTYIPLQFGTKYSLNPSGNINLNLVNAANYQQLSIAKKNRQLAQANTELNIEQIKTSLAQAYYLYLLYQSNYDFAAHNLSNADTLLHITQVRFDNQYIDELDLNRSKSAELQAQTQMEQSRILLEKSLNTLKLLAAIGVSEKLVIQYKLVIQDMPLAEAITVNQFSRPELKTSMLKSNISEMTILREKLRFVPELTAFANYGVIGQNNNFRFSDGGQQWYQSGALGVALNVPVFAGGVKYYSVQKAKLNRQIAALDLQNTQLKTAKEDQDLVLDFVKAKSDLKARQRQLSLTDRNYNLALIKYRNESLTFDNLVNVQNEMLASQQQMLQAEADYVTSQYKIKLINSYDKK
ncbi:MAG: TolC family protein [Bacteroidetes bacterium]|nr:TolC family protein [Bacteroidota bacterium]